jgi:peptide deformylase
MVYPIVAYGSPMLKRRAKNVECPSAELTAFAASMFETMYASKGVGLAAPQIGFSTRVFVVDGSPFADDPDNAEDAEVLKSFKKTFINAEILEESGEEWGFEEGCLSIPDLHETVVRRETLRIKYQDLDGQWHEETYTGVPARIIQHEYDHIEGILFTDRLSPLKKRLIQGRLKDISAGKVTANYRMKFNVA